MKKSITVLSVLLLFFTAVFSEVKDSAAFSYNLQQCVDYACKNQNKMLNATLDEQIAAYKVKEVRGMGLPQINSSLDVKDFFKVPTSVALASRFPGVPKGIPPETLIPLQFGVKYNASAGFDFSQLIFSGAYIIGLQASNTYLELSKKNVERSKIDVAVAVSKAYYSLLVNQERFELLKTNVSRLKKLLDDTKAMYDNGFVEKIDYLRVQVTYNNLLVEKEKVERLLSLNLYLLKFQMGMPFETKLTLTEKIADAKDKLKPLVESKFDFSQRVEYSLLQTQKRLNELDLKKNRYSYLPSIVAYGTYMSNGYGVNTDVFTSTTNWFPMSFIGGKVSLPVFDGWQTHYRLQQSRLSLAKSQNDSKILEQSIELEVISAKASYNNQYASLETSKKNVELAEEVYNTSKIKYDQGVGSNLEIINADASLKEAQTNYYNAMYDVLVSKIDLDKANGLIK